MEQNQSSIPHKGQLILKCPFGVFVSTKKQNLFRISALAPKIIGFLVEKRHHKDILKLSDL